MSRYTGPRLKKVRALGVDLPGLTRKSAERRPYPPGQHGANSRRKKSVYGNQLAEKQKIRYNYGMTEKQLRRFATIAFRKKGDPGANLLSMLERRVDNVVFRMGLAPTIPAARQLVSHGHIRLNGRKHNIASALINVGDVVTVSEKGRKIPSVVATWEKPELAIPNWLELSANDYAGKITTLPSAESVPFVIQVPMVVEYYSSILS